MTFSNPLYLWGLLGILLPVVIHLWSKKKVLTIKMGSIQFINETKSKQHKSIAINEWWLLALRCLIIGLLVLILCNPKIERPIENTKVVYVFEPSLLGNETITKLLDSIPREHSLLLEKEFPEINRDHLQLDFKIPNYWQLADEMKTLPSDSIVVFTQAFVSGIKGKRPSIAPHIQWVTISSSDHKVSEIVKAIKTGDSITTYTVDSDESTYAFAKAKHTISTLKSSINNQEDSLSVTSNGKEKWIPLETQKPVTVTIVYDEGQENQVSILEASFKAIARYIEVPIKVSSVIASVREKTTPVDRLVWLSLQKVDVESNLLLKYQPDDIAPQLIVATHNDSYELTAPLTYQTVYEESLTEALLEWLTIYPEITVVNEQLDKRIISLSQLVGNGTSEIHSNKKEVQKVSIASYIWILLLLFIGAERILAYLRKQ